MKPTEILALLPGFGDAKASAILDSPAWKMPCRYAENPASLVRDTEEIASPLSIRITIGDEKHILCIAKNAAFAELAILWDKRPSVPDTIILALVEKECGALLQTIENTMRKTVKLAGLAETDGESAGRNTGFRLDAADPGQEPIRFSISASDGLVASLGVLRNIDTTSETVRSAKAEAVEIVSRPLLNTDDLARIAPGNFVLMPEFSPDAEESPAELEICGRINLGKDGANRVSAPVGPEIRTAEAREISIGEIFDIAGGAAATPLRRRPEAGDRLLLRLPGGKTANGVAAKVGEQPAMEISPKDDK